MILADGQPDYVVKVDRKAKSPDGQESLIEAVRNLIAADDELYRADVKALPNVHFKGLPQAPDRVTSTGTQWRLSCVACRGAQPCAPTRSILSGRAAGAGTSRRPTPRRASVLTDR